jgi:hypothetical protein
MVINLLSLHVFCFSFLSVGGEREEDGGYSSVTKKVGSYWSSVYWGIGILHLCFLLSVHG